jgi:hypothetical protein
MIGTLPPLGEVAIHIHRELNGSLRAILAPNQKDPIVGVYRGRWLIISDQIWAEIDKKQKDFEAFQEYLTELK